MKRVSDWASEWVEFYVRLVNTLQVISRTSLRCRLSRSLVLTDWQRRRVCSKLWLIGPRRTNGWDKKRFQKKNESRDGTGRQSRRVQKWRCQADCSLTLIESQNTRWLNYCRWICSFNAPNFSGNPDSGLGCGSGDVFRQAVPDTSSGEPARYIHVRCDWSGHARRDLTRRGAPRVSRSSRRNYLPVSATWRCNYRQKTTHDWPAARWHSDTHSIFHSRTSTATAYLQHHTVGHKTH